MVGVVRPIEGRTTPLSCASYAAVTLRDVVYQKVRRNAYRSSQFCCFGLSSARRHLPMFSSLFCLTSTISQRDLFSIHSNLLNPCKIIRECYNSSEAGGF